MSPSLLLIVLAVVVMVLLLVLDKLRPNWRAGGARHRVLALLLAAAFVALGATLFTILSPAPDRTLLIPTLAVLGYSIVAFGAYGLAGSTRLLTLSWPDWVRRDVRGKEIKLLGLFFYTLLALLALSGLQGSLRYSNRLEILRALFQLLIPLLAALIVLLPNRTTRWLLGRSPQDLIVLLLAALLGGDATLMHLLTGAIVLPLLEGGVVLLVVTGYGYVWWRRVQAERAGKR